MSLKCFIINQVFLKLKSEIKRKRKYLGAWNYLCYNKFLEWLEFSFEMYF